MSLFRYLVPSLAALAVLGAIEVPSAQGPAIPDKNITYILPNYGGFPSDPESVFASHLEHLRGLGESPRVRTGFTVYVRIRMNDWTVDVNDPSALRAGMAGTIASIDAAIVRARANNLPIAISFLMPIRRDMDAVQAASQAEDVRNMQWHADNSVATGWWTHSQYARKQRRVMEAYLRELGRVVANRMATYPETLVAVTGDGEVELSSDGKVACQKLPVEQQTAKGGCDIFADYSPFAVLEFRDWLTARGLYATGQPLAAEAYEHAARYRNDPAPNQDGNGDGRTLAGDFGTSVVNPQVATMASWDLKHFDWRLTDESLGLSDPGAIPEAIRSAPLFNPLPATLPTGFDAPRVFNKTDAWWRLWNQFRQQMVHRYNRDFAKWMTTSADPVSGATVPSWRFYSDQIPGDYLNGFVGENADPRLWVSASSLSTGDTSPYGSIGITSFNIKYKNAGDPTDTKDYWARTLAAVGPELAKLNKRWGIIEWNPSAPTTTDLGIYREENALVLKYRPSLLVPFMLDYKESVRVWGTGFEVALKELIQQLGTVPLNVSPSVVNTAAISDNSSRTAPQIVRVTGIAGERTPSWALTAVSGMLDVKVVDSTSFTVQPHLIGLPAGAYTGSITVTPSDPSYSAVTISVTVKVTDPAQTLPPTGAIDTPVDDAIVEGEVAVTGWATDDVGVVAVDLYREPVAGETNLMFIGSATFVEGSRTDIEGLFPGNPQKGRAGWGYMLLSNFLPNGGQGTFTLRAIARDQEGHTALLGTRRIVANNGTAQLPFGTIDTPTQGQTISGVFRNWGWALTPNPGMIPLDGSTIGVYVDNVFVGRPRYGLGRADIAALFPGFANTNTAVGYFDLDTRTLSNGVHTIAWVVRDNLGRAQGIGSRYFTVSNP